MLDLGEIFLLNLTPAWMPEVPNKVSVIIINVARPEQGKAANFKSKRIKAAALMRI